MSEVAFTKDRFDEIMATLSADCVTLTAIDAEPVQRRNTTWQRYEASRGSAMAMLVLHTRWELPDHIVFILSRDMRRICRPSTWSCDTKLVAELDNRLLDADGWYLGDGKG